MEQDPKHPGDKEIIQRVLDGEVNAFEALLKRHEQRVLGIVKKHVPYGEVEETAQEVFIRVYRSLPRFKYADRFEAWISRIAVRTCCDFWRKRYRSKEVALEDLSEAQQQWLEGTLAGQALESLDEQSGRKEMEATLDWALSRLPARERMVLELTYLEGLSGKETAALMECTLANVKVRAFRARKKLEKMLLKVLRP
ncbi:MAG: sigma-70 family RNA polymerase sigma factor [Desulfobacteraceae bacterium]|nr:MAG: sigma-70 family RNA polymerase sigma factor [Desulfobacteraceae bacterium]